MVGFALWVVTIALALDVAASSLVAGAGSVVLTGVSPHELAAQLRDALASIELSRGAPALAAAAFLLLVYRVREKDGLAPPPAPPAEPAAGS